MEMKKTFLVAAFAAGGLASLAGCTNSAQAEREDIVLARRGEPA